MAYIGKSPTGTGVRQRYYFTATGGETSLSGADDNSNTLVFSDGNYVDVSLNGIALVAGTDYNTSTANTIGGLAALSASDIVEILVYDIFTVADTVSSSAGGTFSGAITANSGLNVGTIKEATGTTTAMTIDSSGRVQIKQNATATVSAPASGALVLSGIPDWANKITLVTHDLSPDTTNGFIRTRFTVGGSPTTASIYKYTEARWVDTSSADVEDNGSGIAYIETSGFGNVANLQSYILTFYKVDDYIYKFNGTKYNQQFSSYYIAFSGSIETTAAVDGFSIICSTGNFDNGSARAFWE